MAIEIGTSLFIFRILRCGRILRSALGSGPDIRGTPTVEISDRMGVYVLGSCDSQDPFHDQYLVPPEPMRSMIAAELETDWSSGARRTDNFIKLVVPNSKDEAAMCVMAIVYAITDTFEQLLTYVVFTGWIFYALGALKAAKKRRLGHVHKESFCPTAAAVPDLPSMSKSDGVLSYC